MRPRHILAVAFAAAAVGGQEPVTHCELTYGDLSLRWIAGEGLTVSYRGRRAFVPYPAEYTLHDPAWKGHYYASSANRPTATLRRDGEKAILAVEYPTVGFAGGWTLTAGPDETFSVEYRYRQDRWDDAHLQLGFAKPAEGFWAGSQATVTTARGTAELVIPSEFDPARRTPIVGATAIQLRSVFGTLAITCDRPVTLYDYEQRHGAFFLGYDEPVPRGEERSFRIEVRASPPRFEVGGLVLGGVALPDRVEDGVLPVGITLARREDGPRQVTFRVSLKRAEGEPTVAETTAEPTAEPRPVSVALPARLPGEYNVELALLDPAGRPLWTLASTPVSVLMPFVATPERSLYTTETEGALLVGVREAVPAAGLRFVAEGGGLRIEGTPVPGRRVRMPFEPRTLPDGTTTLACRLWRADRLVAEQDVIVRKAPPKPNEVKIDYASRGLIIDGLLTFPFGAYCFHPPAVLAEQEAAFWFTHLAPYRRTSFADPGAREEMLAALDRCAQAGLRVHYDIRKIATLPDTPEKWELLRQEVEAVRDHPALLAWYLADEPEIQQPPQTPEMMTQAYRFIKELDPYHPCSMVFVGWDKAPDYAPGMDIVMTDPYPIPNRSVTLVSDWTDRLDALMGRTMPLWIVPQAFGGGEGWAREPSAAEGRVMTYLALIHGARGIQYFMRVLPNVRPMATALWAECRRLGAETAELSPALLSTLPQPEVQISAPEVHAAAFATDDAITIVAANTVNQPLPLRLTVAGAPETRATVLFENREVLVRDGAIEEFIDAFGTRAYRIPLREEDPQAGLAEGNLITNPSFEQQYNVGTPDGYYISAGSDPAAAVHVETRLAYHGRHCLRMTTPLDGQGISLAPFPFPVREGATYRLTFWARSLRPGARLRVRKGHLGGGEEVFELDPQWREYSLTGTAPKTERRGQISYRLETAGVAWMDLLQVVEVTEG